MHHKSYCLVITDSMIFKTVYLTTQIATKITTKRMLAASWGEPEYMA